MSGTGWTWQHVRLECDLPTYFALCEWWREVPPAAIQLRRIASFLGLKPGGELAAPRMASPTSATATPTTPSSAQDVAGMAALAGMPVLQGRPADPMFDLLPP